MRLGRLSFLLAAALLATAQVATPAKADTWSYFPWLAPVPSEKPRVTTQIEKPVVAQPSPSFTPPPAVRQVRMVLQRPRSMFSRPYLVIGLGAASGG
jgi:hypothetical protein